MSSLLSIKLDVPQGRLSVDGLSTLVSGRDWSPTQRSNVFVDPITNTAMLTPACTEAAWATSGTGIYAKLGIGDFATLSDSGNWFAQSADQGGPFMSHWGANTAGLQGITATSWPANQPMVVEYFTQAGTNGRYVALEFGWSATGDGSSGVSMRVYSDGGAEVWKDGGSTPVGTYSTAGKGPDYFIGEASQGMQLGGGATQQAQNSRYNLLLLLPCRDRELLVISSGGGGFSHVFEDLAEGVGGLTITDSAPFWFNVPATAMPNIRISPCRFESTGTICGVTSAWRNAPSGPTPTVANGGLIVYRQLSDPAPSDSSGSAIVPSLAASPPNPLSIPNPVQLTVTLNGTGFSTPFIYGLRAQYPPQVETTATPSGQPDGLELLPYVTACRFEVSDTVGGTRVSLGLMQPSAIEGAGATGIATMSSRAYRVFDESGMMIDAISEPPYWTDGFGIGDDAYDRVQEIEIELRDKWKLAENYRFSDPVPLDGFTLASAYAYVATMCGIASGPAYDGSTGVYCSPSCASFDIPREPGTSSGNGFGLAIDVGDTAAEWLDRLHQTFAATYFHGFRPNPVSGATPVLSLIDPTDTTAGFSLPSTPSITLYASLAAAVEAGKGWQQVMRSYQTQLLEPEANDIYVMGIDPRTRKPIVAHKADLAGQAVTAAVTARPANWLGTVRKYAWIDPSITTVGLALACLELLYARLTPQRHIVEFECEYLPGVWRGDLIQLVPQSGTPINVRIKTFRGAFEHLGTSADSSGPDAVWRPCTYVAEPPIAGLESPLDVAGATVRSIASNWHSLKALSRQTVIDNGDIAARRAILNWREGG